MKSNRLLNQQNTDASKNTASKESGKSKRQPEMLNQIPVQFNVGGSSSSATDLPLNHQNITYLQQMIGNMAVGQFIQAKLKIGQPGDKYEQEADRVADQVMEMPDPKLQRQSVNEEEEETVQAKPLADQITPLVQRQEEASEEEEEPVQAKFKDGEMLQRMCPECEEGTAQRQPMEEEKEELQAKTKPGETLAVTPSLESRINSLKGGGQPLPRSIRTFFEPRSGHDFSQVPVHPGVPGHIQPKLTVNEPEDQYEQEADRIDDQVIRMPEKSAGSDKLLSSSQPDTEVERDDKFIPAKHTSSSGRTLPASS